LWAVLRHRKESAKAQPQKALEQPTLNIQRVDLPNLAETFADSIDLVFFDGQTLRINFAVTRFDQPHQAGNVNARRMPACRLVLSPRAAVELMNQIQQLMAKMVQAGVLKAAPPGEKSTA
jgi:hypothetical protein